MLINQISPLNIKNQLKVSLIFPINKNFSAVEFGKVAEYKHLAIENKQMWHLKPKLISAAVGALGNAKKGTKQYFKQTSGFPSLTEVQKIILTNKTHILPKALSIYI